MPEDWVDEMYSSAIAHHPMNVDEGYLRQRRKCDSSHCLPPTADGQEGCGHGNPGSEGGSLGEFEIIADVPMLNLWRRPAASLENLGMIKFLLQPIPGGNEGNLSILKIPLITIRINDMGCMTLPAQNVSLSEPL
jgi:hypothetical protein